MFAYHPILAYKAHVYCVYKQVVQHAKKANAQIGTFGFCLPTLALSLSKGAKRKKPKEPIFLPTLGQTNKETNEMYIEKRDKRKIWAILAT